MHRMEIKRHIFRVVILLDSWILQPKQTEMNYDDHLERYEAKQKELELRAQDEQRAKQIALLEAFKEADQLIHVFIQPELEILRESLVKHRFPAKISVSREVSELSPDSTFDIEIELREDLDPSNPRRGITFTAIPYSKYFSVKMVVSQSQAVKPIVSELKFMEITADSVKDVCGRFVKQAFTV
jgi:hypothetical protein